MTTSTIRVRETFDSDVTLQAESVTALDPDTDIPNAIVAIDGRVAKRIASYWHGGGNTGLTALATMPHCPDDMMGEAHGEVVDEMTRILRRTTSARVNRCEADQPTQNLVELALLLDWIDAEMGARGLSLS